jgi:hypothetical protein
LSAAAIQSMGGGKDDRIFGGDRLDRSRYHHRGKRREGARLIGLGHHHVTLKH